MKLQAFPTLFLTNALLAALLMSCGDTATEASDGGGQQGGGKSSTPKTDSGSGSGAASDGGADAGTGSGSASGGGTDAGTGSGSASGGGSSKGTVPAKLNNKPVYDFGDASGPALYKAAAGAYRVDCTAARGPNTKVGVGYIVVDPDGLTALNADGGKVLALKVEGAAGGASLQAGGEIAILTIVSQDATQISLNLTLKTGDISALVSLGGDDGMMCLSYTALKLEYGAPVPKGLAALAGTYAATNYFGGADYDVVFDAKGKVVVTQTTGPEAGKVVHTAQWQNGIVPVFLQAGEFVMYEAGSTTNYRIQYVSSTGTGGTEVGVRDGVFKRVEGGGVIAVAK